MKSREQLSTEPSNEDIELLAYLLEKGQDGRPQAQVIPRRENANEAPLSFAQQRLWFFDQLEPESPVYNMAGAFRLQGDLNVAALQHAINEVVKRHEVLRSRFVERDGQPVQLIVPELTIGLGLIDLLGFTGVQREAELQRLLEEEGRRPFDLAAGPLIRFTLIQLKAEECVLILALHHIVADAPSFGILLKELAKQYSAFITGEAPELAALAVQYGDFASWQTQRLKGDSLASQLAYWKIHLSDAAKELPLHTDRPRSKGQTFKGSVELLTVPSDLSDALKKLSRQEGVTPFMTLMAALQTLLYRYTAHEKVAVGAPMANRELPEVEALIGFFVNTLAMYTNLSGNPTFRELLQRTREVALAAYENQDVPFERVVQELHPSRDSARNPVFQVLCDYQTAAGSGFELAGLTVTPIGVDNGGSKLDLCLSLVDGPTGLSGFVRYNSDLFAAKTIRRLIGHFQTLLKGALANPAQTIDALPLSTEAEQYFALTSAEKPTCVKGLVDLIAQQSPTAASFVAPGREPLSYLELRHCCEQVTSQLNAWGVGRNDRVAVVLPNGPEMAVAFVAVATAATVAPLNPAYRAKELDFYLADLNAKAVIVQADLDSEVRSVAARLGIPLFELTPELDSGAGFFKLSGGSPAPLADSGFAQPDDVALVLHTSGTTSRPKLVPLTQANICASAGNIRVALELEAKDRCLNVMPLFHIHGLVGALLSSLAAGSSVVCTPGFDAPGFFDWMREFEPTWYTAVPTMHQAIVARLAENPQLVSHPYLRFIRSSSSALAPETMKELEALFNVPVIESYGMTEAAHQMTSNPLPPAERKPGSVGWAAGPDVSVMDEDSGLLSAGATGEIVIRGKNVTAGYENNRNANDKAFSDGWFRTGDQGYLDRDGYLFVTGRLKEIINRGGEKVAPREVDEVLLSHPAVAQAVTFAVPHATLGEDVAAAVVLTRAETATETELREFAFSQLSDQKVPSQIVFVDEIPKGPTGKLQRIGLAEKLADKLRAEFVPPRNETEAGLAEIWSEVLGVARVGMRDNFFTLGGDSLLAAQVVARVRTVFGTDLSLESIFRQPTIVSQASLIQTAPAEGSDEATIGRILRELEGISEEEATGLVETKQGH